MSIHGLNRYRTALVALIKTVFSIWLQVQPKGCAAHPRYQYDGLKTMTSSPTASIPQFPNHAGPRVWFITSASSPNGLAVAQELLKHGDLVVAGDDTRLSAPEDEPKREALLSLWDYAETQRWEERLRKVRIDAR